MPLYCYRCQNCGATDEIVKTMKDADRQESCVICDKVMVRDYGAESKGVVGTEKGETFWSQSLAISPSQAAEHKRLFPNVRVRSDGCIGFDSVKERDAYIDRTGFYKVPGKSKRKGKRIPVKKSPSTPA